LVSERIKRMDEIVPMVSFLFTDVTPDEKSVAKVLAKEGAKRALSAVIGALQDVQWTAEEIEAALRELPEQLELKPKAVFQGVRVAVTGTMVSPPIFESLELLGRELTLSRLEAALPLAAE